MKFYKLLLKHLEASGLTKTDLASKINVSPEYVMAITSGNKKPPTYEKCLKICTSLNIKNAEKDEFLKAAFLDKASEQDEKFLKQIFRDKAFKNPKSDVEIIDVPLRKIPVVSWVHANQFSAIEDHFEIGQAEEYVHSTAQGPNTFALIVRCDCMEPEFREGERIIVRPDLCAEVGDYVVVRDAKKEEATFKQLKKYGDDTYLHPLNPKYDDILLDHDERYEIIGVVVDKNKNYR